MTNDGCGAGELKATWKMKATTGIGSQVLHIYKASDNTEVTAKKVTGLSASTENQTQTISGLDNCTAYYVKVENISQGGSFCGDEMAGTSSSATTKGYTYGITKENVSLKAGETEAASTCDGGFMAEYVANTGYALPGTISVSGVSNFEWDGGVLYIEEENVTGNVTTTIAGICVKPSIGTQPASASYQQGATPVALSVAATLSSGTLTYLWKVSTNDGVSWSDASGTNNAAIYAAANISTANTGTTKYKCIVGNQQGGCEVESDVATIEVTAPSKCLTPTFTVATDTYYEDKSVELGCNTAGVTIYYTTNNTTPTTSSSVYSSAITVTQTTTIKAIAVKAGLIDSDVAEATYTIKCETPTIVLAAGNYTGVQTTTITKGYGTKIYYTTDGSTPSNTNGTEYTGAVSIDQPMTLKAIVWKDGCTNSEVASAAYTLNCTTPTFNYGTGTYTGAQSIMLSGTAGADIYYTLDGTDPSKTHGTKYTAAIEVSANQTVKAIAVKEGWGDSEIASATYTIQYNVYWWVNGTDWNDKGGSTLVTYGQTATAPTTAPTKANGCGDKFMGWTTIPDYEDDDTAPTGMFTETSAAITKETNFYAVFADYGENE
ncbi:MAG: chitobiase/beta-hexosaminidase C-terminal domain-containing protein [Paludibacteraceae bacterium]|nr:chitobiase/beta-hexosaminidase C-terminal domain-containing protein [Paludibacteraceae bacterium]